jgi:3-hydroxy-9,10-secoandrosta-1,3,5(10)-triene-9,17-dione monooxygenase
MGQTSPMGLVEAARQAAPGLVAAIAADDEQGRLGDATWKQLLEGGFLRALQPKRWGGGEVRLVEFVDAVTELSAASPSAGWVAGVIGVHSWQLALFHEQAQQEMWGEDPTAMHSSSYNPTGRAEKVAGGYRLSGRWSFSSGCDHCRGVNLGAIPGTRQVRGADVPDFRSFLLLSGQYRIEDNWNVAGLKATGSKDIVVEDVFVPEHRTQSHLDYATNARLPGREKNDGVLYRLPWSVVFNMALACTTLGSARGFVELWLALARERKLAGGAPAADDPLMQHRAAEATWAVDGAIARLRADALELWQMAEARVEVSMAERGRFRWNMNRGCQAAGEAVHALFHAATGRSIFLDHPLQRRFQDVQGALGHTFLDPDPVARAVGAALLGASKQEFLL